MRLLCTLLSYLLIACLSFVPVQAFSDASNTIQFKSALIYNLMRHVHWSNEQELQSIRLGFIGNDLALFNELQRAASFIKVKNLSVKVVKISPENFDAFAIELLYIGKSKSHLVAKISSYVRQTNTLLVTEESTAQRDFMINIYPEQHKYKFEVNSSNIIFEKLSLDKNILLLGGTELDVAKLLRRSEDSLQQARVEIEKNQQVLTKQQQQVSQYQAELKRLMSTTGKQQQVSNSLKQKLNEQNTKLKGQSSKLAILTNKVTQFDQSLVSKQIKLEQQQQVIEQANNELSVSQKKRQQLKQDIARGSNILAAQKRAIAQQHEKMLEKDHQINSQENLIAIVLSVLAVFILMTAFIYFSYRSKKRLQENLLDSYEHIHTIGHLGMKITASLNFEQAMETLYEHVQNLMDTTIFGIGLYNKEQQSIEYTVAYERGIKYKPYSRSIVNKSQFAVYCLENKKNVFINDVEHEYQKYISSYKKDLNMDCLEDKSLSINPKSLLYIPIIHQNEVKGVISVQSINKNAYSQMHMDLLTTLAAYTSVALENATAHEKIKNAQQHIVMQEKMASLGLLTAGVAHEINNPTNFTRLSAQNLRVDLLTFKALLIELAGEDITAELHELFNQQFKQLLSKLSIILDGTERIQNTVQDLSNFTRQDSGEKSVVSLKQAINSTIRLVRFKYNDRIKFSCSSLDEPNLDCWPALINQVLMNLLVNACDAICLRQKHEPLLKGQVDITLWHDEEQVYIKFIDNGCGMSVEVQQKAFELYFTTKDIGEGTGFGLAISFGIIKKHQGDIRLESTLGEGSCFTISLPYL